MISAESRSTARPARRSASSARRRWRSWARSRQLLVGERPVAGGRGRRRREAGGADHGVDAVGRPPVQVLPGRLDPVKSTATSAPASRERLAAPHDLEPGDDDAGDLSEVEPGVVRVDRRHQVEVVGRRPPPRTRSPPCARPPRTRRPGCRTRLGRVPAPPATAHGELRRPGRTVRRRPDGRLRHARRASSSKGPTTASDATARRRSTRSTTRATSSRRDLVDARRPPSTVATRPRAARCPPMRRHAGRVSSRPSTRRALEVALGDVELVVGDAVGDAAGRARRRCRSSTSSPGRGAVPA